MAQRTGQNKEGYNTDGQNEWANNKGHQTKRPKRMDRIRKGIKLNGRKDWAE